MTKKIKNILIISLFLLCSFSFVLLFSFNNYSAKADTKTLGELSNNDFAFSSESSIIYFEESASTDENYQLKFNFELKNSNHINVRNFIRYYKSWWKEEFTQSFTYNFTLYFNTSENSSDTKPGTDVSCFPVGKYTIQYDVFEDRIDEYIFYTSYNLYSPVSFYIVGANSRIIDSTFYNEYLQGEKKLISLDKGTNFTGLPFNSFNKLAFFIKNSDPYTNYFIDFSASYYTLQGDPNWGMFYGDTRYYSYTEGQSRISTKLSSISSILKIKEASNEIDNFNEPEKSFALKLLKYYDRTVDVYYLSQIGDSPFGERKKATFTYTTNSNTMSLDVITMNLHKQGIALEQLSFLGAHVKSFIDGDSSDEYILTYYPSVWLRSATESGHYADYFYDCNQSYFDMYFRLVEDEIISRGLYDYLFNSILRKYPDLSNSKIYATSDLYGFYGFFATPRDYSLDEVFVDAFDIDKTQQGFLECFSYESEISKQSYQLLLDKYEYSFLETLWAKSISLFDKGSANCSIYISIFDNSNDAFLGEGGQTDKDNPGGAIHNKVTVPFFGAMANGFEAFFSLFSNVGALKSFYMVVIVIALVILIVWVLTKIFNGFNLNIKTTEASKKKKKKFKNFKSKKYKNKK